MKKKQKKKSREVTKIKAKWELHTKVAVHSGVTPFW